MGITIKILGYGDVEFPDGMSDSEIEAAIQENMQLIKPERSWSNVAGSAIQNLIPSTGRVIGDISP